MGTLNTSSYKALHSGANGSVYCDGNLAVTNADIDAADVINPTRVPGGTMVHRVVVKTTDLDTNVSPTLTAKIGFTPIDGSAAPSGADTAVSAVAAFGQSAATTTYEVIPPYLVKNDSFLSIVIDTGAATEAATGTIVAKVEGEFVGIK